MKSIKKVCRALIYFKHSFLVSFFNGCISTSAFVSLVDNPKGIESSAVGIKVWAVNARIKIYKSIIKKKRKKHNKTVLLAKTKLNTIKVFISKTLIDSYSNHNDFISVNNVL